MSENVEVQYALTVNIEDAATAIRQYERLLFKALSLARRMGLGDDINQGIAMMQKAISTLRMLRISYMALQAAAGPVGWATALLGLTIGMMEGGELISDVASQARQSWRPTI